jgi:4-diphosphocytidyl-2-C-methyl-D-erythritol kinase
MRYTKYKEEHMAYINLKSRAKINLSIDVLGKRNDGYHIVEMIMQTIDLYDYINMRDNDNNKINIKSNSESIPLNENNIVYKAAKIIKEKFNIDKGLDIYIQKNIPVAAGMAGGSSNAAAILVGLNEMWNLNINEQDLIDIGLRLGADVPFCITGGAALAQGIGEKLTKIKGLNESYILVCKPDVFVSTAEVYKNLDMKKVDKRPDNKFLLSCLEKQEINLLAKNMVNVLESVTSNNHQDINKIKDIMIKHGALGSIMSGSGPTVFGLFDEYEKAACARKNLKEQYDQTYLVQSSERGVEFER